MTRLLVSVTTAAEALIAQGAGADLIDVKNPARGSLGAQSPAVWQEVLQAVGAEVPVSAALGELYDNQALDLARQTAGLAFAKVGLQGARSQADWQLRWQHWRQQLPPAVLPVLVAYADWQQCDAPSPDELSDFAARQLIPVLLVDTCRKDRGRLRDHFHDAELATLSSVLRSGGSQFVLAGSLQLSDLPALLPLLPDYVAVRGAVCPQSRNGPISGDLVRQWSQAINLSAVT